MLFVTSYNLNGERSIIIVRRVTYKLFSAGFPKLREEA